MEITPFEQLVQQQVHALSLRRLPAVQQPVQQEAASQPAINAILEHQQLLSLIVSEKCMVLDALKSRSIHPDAKLAYAKRHKVGWGGDSPVYKNVLGWGVEGISARRSSQSETGPGHVNFTECWFLARNGDLFRSRGARAPAWHMLSTLQRHVGDRIEPHHYQDVDLTSVRAGLARLAARYSLF